MQIPSDKGAWGLGTNRQSWGPVSSVYLAHSKEEKQIKLYDFLIEIKRLLVVYQQTKLPTFLPKQRLIN